MAEHTAYRVQVAGLSPELGTREVPELIGTPARDSGFVACPVDRPTICVDRVAIGRDSLGIELSLRVLMLDVGRLELGCPVRPLFGVPL